MNGLKLRLLAIGVVILLAGWPTHTQGTDISDPTEQGLIEALTAAAGPDGDNTVTFSLDCSITLSGPIELASDMTIDANGYNVTINGGNAGTIFILDAQHHFTFSGLALTGGASTNGGALYINPHTTVLVTNCLIAGNVAHGGDGQRGQDGKSTTGDGQNGGAAAFGTNALGGGICNFGRLSLISCTLASNNVVGGTGGAGGNGGNGSTSWSTTHHTGGNGGRGGTGGAALGGGIYNAGSLMLSNCTLINNNAVGGAGGDGGTNGAGIVTGLAGAGMAGGMGAGGAIFSSRPVIAINCTFAQNSAASGASAGGGAANYTVDDAPSGPNSYGGGAYLAGGAFTNCTFVTNSAVAGNGGAGGESIYGVGGRGGDGGTASGGALYATGAVSMAHCTVAFCAAVPGTNGPGGSGSRGTGLNGNPGLNRGSGLSATSSFFLMNSILATNFPGGNASGTYQDGGYNISTDVTPHSLGKTSRNNTDPKIKLLADNGGPTNIAGGMLTVALFDSSSPAYKAIPTNSANYVLAFDERGGPRPGGGKHSCDIGSYEIGPPFIPDVVNPLAYYPSTNGGGVTLSVLPVGDSPLYYYWQFNGGPLGTGNGSSSYTIDSVTNENDGPYSITVSNLYGAYTSTNVFIHFIPGVYVGPTNTIVQAGKPASLGLQVTGNIGDTNFTYQWRRSIRSSDTPTNIPGALGLTTTYTNNSLTISRPTTNDSGFYCVVVSNSWGSITSAVCTLSVDQIVFDLTNQTVAQGSNVTFSVGALGNSLTYAWYVNGTLDQGHTGRDYTTVATTNATFYVIVSDGTELTMNSSVAQLTVVSSPPANGALGVATNSVRLANPPGSLDVVQGTSVLLTNSASGGGLNYQWWLQGKPIAGATNSFYQLNSAQFFDSGQYTVVVTNLLGSLSAGIQLNVLAMTSNAQVTLPNLGATGVRMVGASNAYAVFSDNTNGSLLALDVSNPVAPNTTQTLPLAGPAQSLFVAGGNAYVACGAAGLEVFDVSAPANPSPLATYSGASVQSCFVTNGYAYLACGSNGLQVLDVHSPAVPALVTNLSLGQANGVWLSGNNAFVAAGTNGLVVLGLDHATNVTFITNWTDGANTHGVLVAGNEAYLAASAAGVRVVDVSDPAHPALTNSETDARSAQALALAAGYLAVADRSNGLVTLDVSTPAQPQLAGISAIGDVRDVDISGRYAYAATASGLVVLDAAPTLQLAPAVRIPPQPATVMGGSNVTLSVSATGTQPLSYQWLRSGSALADGPSGSGSTNLGTRSATLTIQSVQKADTVGAYSVVIANAYGGVTSSVAQLTWTPSAYTFSPASETVSADGTNNDAVQVVASSSTPWTISTTNAWIHPQTSSGAGSGTVVYNVDGGTDARTGYLLLTDADGAVVFTINQNAYVPPTYVLSVFATGFDDQTEIGFNLDTADLYGDTQLSTYADFYPYPDPSAQAWYSSNAVVRLSAPGTIGDTGVFQGWQLADGSGAMLTNGTVLTVRMTSDLNVLAVYRTPYEFVNGTYNGLFFNGDSGVDQKCSGYCKITTTSKAKYSATLQIGSSRYSFSGQFDTNSAWAYKTNTYPRFGTLTLGLALTNYDSDYMNGTVELVDTNGDDLVADLIADRATFDGKYNIPNQVGSYTMILPGNTNAPDEPVGDGYGTVKVSKTGVISFAGALADGTKLTQSAGLSKDGYWPLYVPLYSGKGSTVGWMYFGKSTLVDGNGADWGINSGRWDNGTLTADLAVSGAMAWIKPIQSKAKYYPDGFTIYQTNTWGLRFASPTFQNGLFVGTGELILSGGDFDVPLTNYVTLNNNNTVSSTNKTSLSISRSTGTFSGRVYVPITNVTSRVVKGSEVYKTNVTQKALSFSGVILTNASSGVGAGYFLGTNQSGRVVFQEKW